MTEHPHTPLHGTQHRTLHGPLLADPDWLTERVRDTGRRWDCPDARVNGTLWWYSASSTLVAEPLATLLTSGRAGDPSLESLRIALRTNGYLASATSDRLVDGHDFASALRGAHTAVIESLAAVSGAAPRALWAIASDSIANRALDAGREMDRVEEACALARDIAAPPLLRPRYVDVEGPAGSSRFVRRSSCCLIYAATDGEKCVSCPRRTPSDRAAELRRRAGTL